MKVYIFNFHFFHQGKFFTIAQFPTLELEGEVTQFVLKEMCFSKVIPLVLSVNTFNFAITLRKRGHGFCQPSYHHLKYFPQNTEYFSINFI